MDIFPNLAGEMTFSRENTIKSNLVISLLYAFVKFTSVSPVCWKQAPPALHSFPFRDVI